MKPIPVRILCVGDSITRGSYLAVYSSGPYMNQAIGLPNPQGGGYRKYLQDKLIAAAIPFEFVGELDYGAYGHEGVVDPDFSPYHHGLAGFGSLGILQGGVVPTPMDVLNAKEVAEIRVPGIVQVLEKHKPDMILLMSGTNGCDAAQRDLLIHTALGHFSGQLFVATIPPQKPPRDGYENVGAYNASLAGVVEELAKSGKPITYVDINAALTTDELRPDGVHPNDDGMQKIAETWWNVLKPVLGASTSQRSGA
jgi:lysophospholipase L1-like esterase